MRTYVTLLWLTLCIDPLWAQDPGTMAAQQATQMATQIAAQNAQQASDQAMRDAQQAAQNAQNAQQQTSFPDVQCHRCYAAMPKFSVKPGKCASAVTVKIRDATRGAVIYYTTDGWTPTEASTRYTGPITIESTTSLQAIAISPYGGRSRVAIAVYTLNGMPPTLAAPAPTAAPSAESLASANDKLLLARGTAVPLAFATEVSSKTADVGDKITLTLAEGLKAGDVVVAKKGAPSVATVTEVDKPGMGGMPGAVFFQADSLQVGGVVIKLRGGAAKEGQDKVGKVIGLMFVPMFPAPLFVHGKEAEIKQGAVFTAFVDADTVLPPAK